MKNLLLLLYNALYLCYQSICVNVLLTKKIIIEYLFQHATKLGYTMMTSFQTITGQCFLNRLSGEILIAHDTVQ